MATALVLTVGTTPDPLIKAVEEAQTEDMNTAIFLFYGRPFPNQSPSPFDVAAEVKARAEALGLKVRLFEAADPEDFNLSLHTARELLKEAGSADRLIVNYTGGTKPLSASLIHAALTTPIAGEVIFDYTGGVVRDKAGRVIRGAMQVRRSEATLTQELCREILALLQGAQYTRAAFLARRLPELGRGGFLKQAANALLLWNDLNYAQAVGLLRRLYLTAKAFADDLELGTLSQTLLRLLEPGNTLASTIQHLERIARGEKATLPSLEDIGLLCADILENAGRQQREGKATEAVLRAYRALEIAVQGALLHKNINPWQPQWAQLPEALLQSYREKLKGELPKELALTTGLSLWELLFRPLNEQEQKKLDDLRYSRNHSYLEHGLERRSDEDAKRLISYAQELDEIILEMPLTPLRSKIHH